MIDAIPSGLLHVIPSSATPDPSPLWLRDVVCVAENGRRDGGADCDLSRSPFTGLRHAVWTTCCVQQVNTPSSARNTKIVICPILSNRGSFRYCLVRKSRTIAKITSTGRCTTLRRLEEVLCASSTPQWPRWQSFHTAKQKQQQNRGIFLKTTRHAP